MPELLTFVETAVFTKRISALGLEKSLRGLQLELLDNPEAGDLEPGTAGLRKIRLGDPTRGKGKRGGARVHYLWLPHRGRIYLMFVYGKNEAITLTTDQRGNCERSSHKSKRQILRKSQGDEGRNVYRTRRLGP